MKKLIIGFSIVAVLSILVYLIIPNFVTVKRSVEIYNNPRGITRALSNENEWSKWWPGNYDKQKGVFILHDNSYSFEGFTGNAILLKIQNPLFTVSTKMILVDAQRHVQNIYWGFITPTSYNPIKRVKAYLAATSLEKDMGLILSSINTFYADTVNLYGVKIERNFVKDSTLIFTYDSVKGYPSNEKIYSLINTLRDYIKASSALATDSPMVNVYTSDSIYYLTKVAIPTNKPLPSAGKIQYKWMLGNGNILTADVTGDSKAVQRAFAGMENYVHDFELASPAIPFSKLLTNRLAEKDSTQWRTRIYYPVMYYKD